MGRLKVLVLHSLGDPEKSSISLGNQVFALQKYCPEHEFVYHDTTIDRPWSLAGLEVDAIILDVTFLCARWAEGRGLQRLKRDYAFIADCTALKLAFPQDEYDCNALLDEWMCEWRVDVVFSVIAEHWNILYPKYSCIGEIRLAYTGYIDDSLTLISPTPWDSRTVDIGYRAKKLPPYFGSLGEVKWQIGELVNRLCSDKNITTDIVVGDTGTLNGAAWLDFINNSKFTLGANSGSSLLDPQGDVQRNVRRYLASHPRASFKEVEQVCFLGLDGLNEFTAISPRVIEAGLLGSCQILVDGHYSGILKPWEHYIPITADASNFDEVLEAMQNRTLTDRLIANCRTALLNTTALHYRSHANEMMRLIVERTKDAEVGMVGAEIGPVIRIKIRRLMFVIQRFSYSALRSGWRVFVPKSMRTWIVMFRQRF